MVTAIVRAGFSTEWLADAAYTVILLGALALTARAIVHRPSGFVDASIRDADDALRGHGLTVLVGSAIALLYPAIWTFAVQTAYPTGVPHSIDPSWVLLIFVGCVAVGWFVASRSRSVRASRAAVATGA